MGAFFDRLDVGEFEDAKTVVETYRVYDIGNDEWVDVGVRQGLISYFVDPQTQKPIDLSDISGMEEMYGSIDLFEKGRENEQGNRFLTTTEECRGNFLSIKSYQDGEIKTLLTPEYDRQQWGNGFDLSLEKVDGDYWNDMYIINENGGKALIQDDGVEMKRVDDNHYDEIEQLDDGAFIGVKDGDRSAIVLEE